jgi:uncharacterized delta-60 repeat protein
MRSKLVRNSVTVSGFPGGVSLPLFLLLLGMPLPALTDPGDLDPTFGSGGRVLTDLGGGDGASALVVQPDGKVVAAGGSTVNFALARYHPDGSLLVAAGASTENFALARYHPDGSLDSGFGNGGVVLTDFGAASGAEALVLQPDAKLVAAGRISFLGTRDFALARYNADGSLDTSFDGDGRVLTDFGGPARALLLQPDGKLVAAGRSFTDFALVRYNPNGSLDTGFGDAGLVLTDFGPSGEAFALGEQPDGKLVAAGGSSGNFALVRYNPDGGLLERPAKTGSMADSAGTAARWPGARHGHRV